VMGSEIIIDGKYESLEMDVCGTDAPIGEK
jgi:hypothetical protein